MKVALEIILKVFIILKSVAKRANTDTPKRKMPDKNGLELSQCSKRKFTSLYSGTLNIHKILARSIFTQNYLRWTKRLSFEKGPSQAQENEVSPIGSNPRLSGRNKTRCNESNIMFLMLDRRLSIGGKDAQ